VRGIVGIVVSKFGFDPDDVLDHDRSGGRTAE
jgi:hypothetical protein